MKRKRKDNRKAVVRNADIKRSVIKNYFLDRSQWHREWLKELACRYKAKGDFPIIPMVLLPSYYEDNKDMEVAAFAALMLNKCENTLDAVSELRNLLGKSPWEWFVQRKFVSLSLGVNQDGCTGGIPNWKIAKLFGRLWDECHVLTYEIPNEKVKESVVRPIGEQVKMIVEERHYSYFDALTYLLEDCSIGRFFYKIRLLLQVLSCSGGFSLGLWSVEPSELKCPVTYDLLTFLQTWFPDYYKYGSADDAISLFGFESDCDFFYAYLGYKELQKRNPRECSKCATKYRNWYDNAYRKKPYKWREITVEIPF